MTDYRISKAFGLRCDRIGKVSEGEINEIIAAEAGLSEAESAHLEEVFKSFTQIAVDLIGRSYKAHSLISREDALRSLRNCMFFLDDDSFQKFVKWINWCVSKGG